MFSAYVILVYRDLCPLSIDKNYYSDENVALSSFSSMSNHFGEVIFCNLTAAAINPTIDNSSFSFEANLAIIAWICLLIFTIALVVRELTEFYDQKNQNFLEVDTWIHFWIVAMFFLCSFHQNPFTGNVTVYRYQHHAAAWGMFATWIQMMLYMERTPQFGVYILLLRKVARTILNLFVAYSSLLTAFALTFYLIFPGHYAFDNGIATFVKVKNLTICNIQFISLFI